MPHLRTLLASTVVVLVGSMVLLAATDHFKAFTSETARRVAILRQPVSVPPVQLQTQTGSVIKIEDLRGQWLLVDFIYTSCPTYCSALGSEFARLQDLLAKPIADNQLTLLSISFDPQHDTPENLAAYQQRSRTRGGGWIATRPTGAKDLQRLLRTFGVTVIADEWGGYTHNTAIAIVDPQGRLIDFLDQGNPAKVAEIMLQKLARQTTLIAADANAAD